MTVAIPTNLVKILTFVDATADSDVGLNDSNDYKARHRTVKHHPQNPGKWLRVVTGKDALTKTVPCLVIFEAPLLRFLLRPLAVLQRFFTGGNFLTYSKILFPFTCGPLQAVCPIRNCGAINTTLTRH